MTRLLPCLIVLGCSGADADPEPPQDACELTAAPADFTYSVGPYGAHVGDVFADFELEDCDGEAVAFHDVLAGAELVLFNVGAGWCAPCIEETRTLQADVFAPRCGGGLAVVQVLFEDANARPATQFFCREWRDAHGLGFPVLRDPLFTTERFFEDAQTQTPLNLLIDRTGRVVYREVGTAGEGLIEAIDAHLEREG